jgi:anti-anti-sigma regulatory factor
MKYNDCTILQCEPTAVPGCWYILAEGSLDLGPPLEAFVARVRQAVDAGARWMVFDARRIRTYLDCGHGAMVDLADRLRRAGGGAILLRMDTKNRATFGVLGIEHYFRFVESMEEALTIARQPPQPPVA